MYFQEDQLIQAAQYLKKYNCEDDSMPRYFDFPGRELGMTVRAEYKNDTFHIFITPHWEAFRYSLFKPTYATLLGTSFLADKIKELFETPQKYCVKVDNRQNIFEGELYEEFYEEDQCFYLKN